ncbi:MAG: tRNA lysidine(34) synthetase TilS [Desulfofustis sp.]|nr:tRNA lysidine(34) synthetase TilS [Desulfofustis sp.]
MSTFEQKILSTIETNQLMGSDQSAVIAVSGGPDSICLLHALCNLYDKLTATCVYIDHHLRPDESALEAKVVETHCLKRSIGFMSITVDVPAEAEATGDSIEACARRLRYNALEQVRSDVGADIIAVGHTADDQVEELLLRLIRGSGLKGLSGMGFKRGRVIRPLLEISRQEVLAYLDTHGHEFCHDSSNESVRFLRNRIRLELLPVLEQRFNPAIRSTILNTVNILKQEEEFISAESDRFYRSLVRECTNEKDPAGHHSISFATESLTTIPAALRRRLFERACWETGCRPDFQHIDTIDKLLAKPVSGTELHLPDGVRVVRQHDSLLFTKLTEDQGPRESVAYTIEIGQEIEGSGSYVIPVLNRQLDIWLSDSDPRDAQLMRIDRDTITFPILLRSTAPGDRFTPLGGPGSKKVARFLGDRKIPHHLRHLHPVLESDAAIICVLGLEIDERCRITETTTQQLHIRWVKP